ncbi:MAG: hypothetical protein AMXMBFR77_27730 [Phycisphaerales bacterium]
METLTQVKVAIEETSGDAIEWRGLWALWDPARSDGLWLVVQWRGGLRPSTIIGRRRRTSRGTLVLDEGESGALLELDDPDVVVLGSVVAFLPTAPEGPQAGDAPSA